MRWLETFRVLTDSITIVSVDDVPQRLQLVPLFTSSLLATQNHRVNGLRLETGWSVAFLQRIDVDVGITLVLSVFGQTHYT